MRFRAILVLLVASLGFVAPLRGVGSAAAATTPGSPGASIDLSQGWGSYQACLLQKPGPATCFKTDEAMRAATASLTGSSVDAAASASCPVTLFSGFNYGGRALAIYARGFWLNLSDYGFDNATVSFVANGCGFHLAEGYWGGGYWYPGYTGPWAYTANMGSAWDYRVSSIYIP